VPRAAMVRVLDGQSELICNLRPPAQFDPNLTASLNLQIVGFAFCWLKARLKLLFSLKWSGICEKYSCSLIQSGWFVLRSVFYMVKFKFLSLKERRIFLIVIRRNLGPKTYWATNLISGRPGPKSEDKIQSNSPPSFFLQRNSFDTFRKNSTV